MAFSPLEYTDDSFVAQAKQPIDSKNEAFFADPMVITKLLPVNFVEQLRQIPGVLAATPFLLFRFKQGQDGHIFSVGGLDSANPKALKGTATTKRDIVSGVFFKPGDRKVVLIDESYALMWNLKVGSVVNIADTLYPVIGIVRPGVRPIRADIYMNWPDAEEAINKRLTKPLNNEANIFLVETKGVDVHASVIEKTEKLMQNGIVSTFNCSLPGIEVLGISKNTIKIVVSIVFILVLLFAANSQWIAVLERAPDIAILKAIGWKDSTIFHQILIESLILALLGAFVGSVGGYVSFLLLAPKLFPLTALNLEFILLLKTIIAILVAFSFIGIFAGALCKCPLAKANLKTRY